MDDPCVLTVIKIRSRLYKIVLRSCGTSFMIDIDSRRALCAKNGPIDTLENIWLGQLYIDQRPIKRTHKKWGLLY